MKAKSDAASANSGLPPGISAADRAVANQAYKKALEGAALTATEQSALKRYETAKEEQLRWRYYSAIPQKHWRQMSGRQTKVLHDQAKTYGLPIGGATIDLPAFVRAFHDFLAANSRVLSKAGEGGTSKAANSPALERYREERAKLARLDRLEREAELMPRVSVQEGLGRIAALLRGMGEVLQKTYGPDALRLLDETLDDAEREMERLFGSGVQGADSDETGENLEEEDLDADTTPPPA